MISVIVAAYNVEKYIEKCILSLVNQTYKNLEIIVVNDGSSDNTLDKIIRLKQEYSNITVINQENKGLSAARNIGILNAKGEFIGFIDGDDYVKEDMYELLLNNLRRYTSDISICGVVRKYAYKEIYTSTDEIKVMNRIEALKNLIESKFIHDYAVDKLYKKSLFDGIKYPEGKTFEDVYTTYKLFNQCNKIVYQDTPKYYYIQREGSILRSKFSDKQFHQLEALYCIDKFVKDNNWIELQKSVDLRIINIKCRLIYDILKNKCFQYDSKYDLSCMRLMKDVKNELFTINFITKYTLFTKIMITLSNLGFKFSCKLFHNAYIKKIISRKR